MRILMLVAGFMLVSGCSSTSGNLVADGQETAPSDKALIAFSVQVTDGTKYDNCSVFVGRKPSTARWFGWPVQQDGLVLVALEVEPGRYGFHRFGCMYRSLQLSTSVAGPQFDLRAGEIRYLGRLLVSDTEMGSAARHKQMPTSVRLDFEDRRDEDLELFGNKWPLFAQNSPTVDTPATWGGDARYLLRPYRDGIEVVVAPVL